MHSTASDRKLVGMRLIKPDELKVKKNKLQRIISGFGDTNYVERLSKLLKLFIFEQFEQSF